MKGDFSYIKKLFKEICELPLLDDKYGIVFVYNSTDTMDDHHHTTECVLEEECHMIITAFQRVAKNVYAIDGEEQFMEQAKQLKARHSYVMVYSMAQNITGRGRRSLIPLLCDYYGFINIGADFMSCFFARSKDLMYSILKTKGFPFPETYFIKEEDVSLTSIVPKIKGRKWVLKPNDESSSIGLQVHEFDHNDQKAIYDILTTYHHDHPVFCIQEFIDGEEVAVPVLKIKDHYYVPGISQVNFPEYKNYIDYDMVFSGIYDYFEYQGPIKEQLMAISIGVAKELHLTAMSRVDFRIRNNVPYIEDINANPTISEANGVNQLYCDYLSSQPWCIYAVITYAALINAGLFQPSFYEPK